MSTQTRFPPSPCHGTVRPREVVESWSTTAGGPTGARLQGVTVLRLHNTLTRRAEEVETREPGIARMYTCGPTVYRYAHIGNLRSYLMADWIRRALLRRGYEVTHVKNITDVGHMRQEMLEQGGDRVILAALEEGKTPQEIAQFYAQAFHDDEARLNILPAQHYPWATDHVPEMVALVEQLMNKEYAYLAGGNIYFDVARFQPYGALSGNQQAGLMEGVRMEADPLKRDPRDFTLWKLAEPGRDMKWDSPWGEGFPGWHIECSAMSTKYLGQQLDIHTGGVDNIFPHHEDEIAQSEAAFDTPYVRYWVHGQHLLADGVKMAKSSGNVFILDDLVARGFDPLAFRYLCLTVRYRNRMNFTFSALKASQSALTSLQARAALWRQAPTSAEMPPEAEEWRANFWDKVENDLDLPSALATVWHMAQSPLPEHAKLALLQEFDQVLGLDLGQASAPRETPAQVGAHLEQHNSLRNAGSYGESDALRQHIASHGYVVEDRKAGASVRPKTPVEYMSGRFLSVSSPKEVESYLDQPPTLDFSMVAVVSDYMEDVKRVTRSALTWAQGHNAELVVVDNGSTDGAAEWLEELRASDSRVNVIHTDHVIGEGAAKNIGLKQCRGRTVLMLDPSVEVIGDILTPVDRWLDDERVSMVGPWGVCTDDIHHFHDEVTSGESDAMQAYCQGFRRSLLNEVGLMRECFRFYRNLDLDFSFQIKDLGHRIFAVDDLPILRHEHRVWAALDEGQRNALSFKNFKRFFKRWGDRGDLLVASSAQRDSS